MKLAAAALFVCLVAGSSAQQADRIDALFARIDAHVAKLGRPAGTAELAKSLGGDPERVRAFLAAIDLEPYAGVLKGPEGVLATRAGNSFDRALLAAELLKPAKVRFAVGPGAPALKRAARAKSVLPAGAAAKTDWKKAAEKREALWARVDGNVAALSALLQAKGVTLGGPEAAAERDVCWLEVERQGAWAPLEDAPGEARERFDAIPAGYLHRVEVFARLERSVKGEVKVEEILKVEYPTKDLAGLPLTFQVVPAPGDPGPARALAAGNGLKAAPLEGMRAVRRWVPSVRLGRGGQYGKAFDFDGKLWSIDASKGFSMAAGDVAGDRVAGLLRGGRGGAETGAPTALWWGLRRHAPGRPAETWEREVVDLAGFGQPRRAIAKLDAQQADRLRLAFLGVHEVRAHLGGIDAAEGVLRIRRSLEPWRRFFKAARDQKRGRIPLEKLLQAFEREKPAFTAFEVLRGSFLRDLERRAGARSFLPAAGLVIVHSEFVPVGDRVKLRESFDIVDLQAAVEGPEAARFRLALGVLDTELELETCTCRPKMVNTASLIRAAKPELRCLVKPEEADGLGFKPAAKARVKAELAAGRVVIAPSAEIDGEAVWWRIDPKSGAALGIGETGYGQTAVEYWMEVHDRIKDSYAIGEVLYCYLTAIWSHPVTWDASAGIVAPPALLKEILKCIPVCDGLGKVVDFPDVDDPLTPFVGESIEAEFTLDANDACEKGEEFLDNVLLAE
jgi:hypothetical protein